MFQIATADELVTFIQNFTGSNNTDEIKKCIFLAEMSMRNIELPALRSDPYDPQYIGVVDAEGGIQIPGDMNKPILFFKQGVQYITSATATGTSGQNTITLTSTPAQNITTGMIVSGTGIASGATVTATSGGGSGSTITLSLPNTGSVSGTLIFQTPPPASNQSQTGPWIVYDRIGDRDIITQSMIAQLYLQPVNVPAVIRGKFSEVGNKYEFLPYIAQGDLINMYYYKAWPLLFSPVDDTLISATGTITSTVGQTGTLVITNTGSLSVGMNITATDGSGTLGDNGTTVVTSIVNTTTLTFSTTGTAPTSGTVTQVYITNQNVQNNAVLATWPEGYVYATLREYFIKRHNDVDAQTAIDIKEDATPVEEIVAPTAVEIPIQPSEVEEENSSQAD